MGTWILIFTNFVPISLLVSLEMVKFWQAGFMQRDILMYDKRQDLQMIVNSSNINEELGQVKYVFSDKTGTLTCNQMDFIAFSTLTQSYSINAFDPATIQQQERSACQDLAVVLAVCHAIVIDPKTGKYNASSPDELALVEGAKRMGFTFE